MIILIAFGCNKEAEETKPLIIEYEITHVSSHGLSDGAIDITVKGGLMPYSYNWSDGITAEDITNIPAGEYSVTVTDAGDSTAKADFAVTQPSSDTLVFDIEGNAYRTVKITGQLWMKENLRVTRNPQGAEITSYCYGNDTNYASTYGRLYTWDVAMNGSVVEMAQGICPDGWHIPSDEEWKELEMNLGMTQQDANKVNTWRGDGIGTSMIRGGDSGYEALLSGRRNSAGYYSLLNEFEYMWTSTEYGENAWRRCLNIMDDKVGRWNTFPKTYAFSVRCIKDE
ncbi:MAG: hypothetical protein JXB00_03885 [Bacteroidales bacterium]|nr:hypothetical protein [Bacteroidales bacterium]